MKKGTKRKATQKPKSVEEETINEPNQADVENHNGPNQVAKENHNGPNQSAKENQNGPSHEPSEPVAAAAADKPTKQAGKRPVKRAKIPKPEAETEYFEEKRNLEDLWKEVFPVGTEWDQLDVHNWNFKNLEEAFEENGELYGKKVYLFGCTESQMEYVNGEIKVRLIFVVVAVTSQFPPSDKIGIASVQMANEDKGEVHMKQMKMDWFPYIPLYNRDSQVEKLKSQIFILGCTQRRAGLKNLKLERLKKFEYCLPYFCNPFQEDEIEQSTVVNFLYPMKTKLVSCEFDWELDELEEYTDNMIKEEEIDADEKEAFKKYVREKVREAKKANREVREARKKAIEEMSEEKKAAFQEMKILKFYPLQTDDIPEISKTPFINRYYGKAHQVL